MQKVLDAKKASDKLKEEELVKKREEEKIIFENDRKKLYDESMKIINNWINDEHNTDSYVDVYYNQITDKIYKDTMLIYQVKYDIQRTLGSNYTISNFDCFDFRFRHFIVQLKLPKDKIIK
jgi:hypothetical protein